MAVDPARAGAVTVVIPAHDAADTLGSTLASLSGQEGAPPFEVVVVDDGSTDGTRAIAEAWADRIALRVEQTGGRTGVAHARNLGIGSATTPLVALVDADDVVFPDHLAMLAALHRGRLDVVTADPLRWIPGRAVAKEPWSARARLPAHEQQHAALLQSCWVFIGTLFDRSLFDEVGGFRTDLRRGEDWDVWLRMAAAGARFVRPPHPTMLYRLRAGSATTDDELIDDVLRVLRAARQRATTPEQRRSVALGLRRTRAEQQLYTAYRRAAAGKVWAARRAAAVALTGNRRVAVRGAAMAIAPSWAAQRRAAVRYEPEAWLER